jgi:hypothetical protein
MFLIYLHQIYRNEITMICFLKGFLQSRTCLYGNITDFGRIIRRLVKITILGRTLNQVQTNVHKSVIGGFMNSN